MYQDLKSYKKVGEQIGKSKDYVRRKIKVYKPLTTEETPVEVLVQRRIEDFDRKKIARTEAALIRSKVNIDGPFGITFFGDPHIDCDGTDIKKLLDDAKLVNDCPFLIPACLGDITNNWVGRLGHLYGQQSTSASDAITLAKHFVTSYGWMFVILGNHDCWTRPNSFLEWMSEHSDAIIKPYGVTIELETPSGRNVRIKASHHFNGGGGPKHPAQGVAKTAQNDLSADIYVAGHTHQSGYQFGWNPAKEGYWHAVRVGSYKVYDEYADAKWLTTSPVFNCATAIIDPEAQDPLNFIRWEWTPEEAIKRLTWMRS